MDRSYYASIEVGRRNVSLSNLCKIANGFDMTIAALMTGVTEKTDQSINQSANAVSESIDGTAGGKVTARDRAASFASEGGQHRCPYSLSAA